MPALCIRVELAELRAEVSQLSEGVLDNAHFAILVGSVCEMIWRPKQPYQLDYTGSFSVPRGNGRDWLISNAGQQRQIVIAVERYLIRFLNMLQLDFNNRLMYKHVNTESMFIEMRVIVVTPTVGVAL